MSILFSSITVRSERRLRLLFTNTLAAGAFSNLALYLVASTDLTQPTPTVVAAILVPNTPNGVDIQVDTDLTDGAPYTVTAVGVPCTDSSVTPAGSVLPFSLATPIAVPNVEIAQDDVDALTYGVDLVHDGTDYVEGPDGDLATSTGAANAVIAVMRRELSDGLPWNDAYGGKLRSYIDGPAATPLVRGRLIREAMKDDRIAKIVPTIAAFDPLNPGNVSYNLAITPVGAGQATVKQLRVKGS